MVIGITMLKVLLGYEVEAYNFIKNLKGVKDAYPIVGEYSIFVVIQAENNSILYSIINSLKDMPEVTSIWHILVSKTPTIMAALETIA